MNKYEISRQLYIDNNKVEVYDAAFDDLCNLITRQTDYDKTLAKEKLIEHDLNVLSVVREWLGCKPNVESKKSTNQMVFGEFRKFLTEAAIKYKKKTEREANFKKAAAEELARREKMNENTENEIINL